MPGMRVTDKHITMARHYLRYHATKKYGDVVPSQVGLACALSVNRSSLTNCQLFPPKAKDSTPGAKLKRALRSIMEQIQVRQHKLLLTGGLGGTMNSNIVKLMLGKHGYSEKKEQQITGKDAGPVIIDNNWTIHVVKAGKK